MKGQMKVKKLNDTGLYISEMDWDNTYICKENPIGNFVMVIEPLSGFDGGIIYFDKKTDGYLIEGEDIFWRVGQIRSESVSGNGRKNMSRRGSLLWNINREPLSCYYSFFAIVGTGMREGT